MSAGEIAWNAYFDKFGKEPANQQQLQTFAKNEASLDNLNYKTARDTFNTNKGNGRIDGIDVPSNNLAPPATQDVVPSDTENEEYEYYEEEENGDYEYYDEEEAPQQQEQQATDPNANEAYEYYEDDGYEYYDEEEPQQQQEPEPAQIEEEPVAKPPPARKAKPPPPRARKKTSNAGEEPVGVLPTNATTEQVDEYAEEEYYYEEEEDPYDEPAGDGQADTNMTIPATPVTPSNPRMASTAAMIQPMHTTAPSIGELSDKDDDKNSPCKCCPFSYICIACTALTIAILALLIAVIPLVLYSTTHNPNASRRRLGSYSSGSTTTYRKIYHHKDTHATRPKHIYTYAEPMTHAESWGDDFSHDFYVGGGEGWEYVAGWESHHDPVQGFWNTTNDQWRLYPFSELVYVVVVRFSETPKKDGDVYL